MRWWFSTTDITPALLDIRQRLQVIAERMTNMPTRAELDAAKQALSQEIQTVVQHINDLEQQLQQGQPITQQDIDDLKNDLATLQGTNPPPQP